jgi:hypothetical protein
MTTPPDVNASYPSPEIPPEPRYPATSATSSDVRISADQVASVGQLLNNSATNLVPQLTSVAGVVNNLLQPDGGLYLLETSPALNEQYSVYHASLLSMVSNLTQFASLFNQTSGSLVNADQTWKNQVEAQTAQMEKPSKGSSSRTEGSRTEG